MDKQKVGFSDEQAALIERALMPPDQSWLISGTSGGGKTNTLKSFFTILETPRTRKIIEIASPVESESKSASVKKINQKGMSIIELMFCAAIILFAVLVINKTLLTGSQSIEISDLGQRARVATDDALTALGSQPAANLASGGSFYVEDLNTIRMTAPCSISTCDYVLLNQSSETTELKSPANGVPYTSPAPADSLLRRWRVENLDDELNLKRLTIVVVPDENSVEPIRIETAVIGLNR